MTVSDFLNILVSPSGFFVIGLTQGRQLIVRLLRTNASKIKLHKVESIAIYEFSTKKLTLTA